MWTISKVFTIPCLLCQCGNREHPSSFQNKSVSSSFNWVPKYILFLVKLKQEGKPFWSGQAQIYPLNYLLHVGGNVNYQLKKCLSSYSYSACRNREQLGNFQNKSVSSPFSWVHRYILVFPTWRGEEGLFWGVKEGHPHCEITPKSLVVIRDENVSFFVKIEIILPFLCFLLDLLINRHCRTWGSMINLRIDSRTCQK